MKTKTYLIMSIALLLGVSAWAQDPVAVSVYEDCSKNGKTYDFRLTTTGEKNGHTWVDLCLPSGTQWASCNVGATTPEGYGNYYAWGEITTKDNYSWANYKYANGASDKLTKYCSKARYGDNDFTDNLTTLEPEDDAAHVNWGEDWRMPTHAEWTELRNNCTWTWTAQNGVNGYQVTSKANSNSIFLPAAGDRYGTSLSDAGSDGYYSSASLNDYTPSNAWCLRFASGYMYGDNFPRHGGRPVRPVCQTSSSDAVTLTFKTNGCESANVVKCDAGRQITITAVPANEHRHFVRWSDGNTDNPRTVSVEGDATYTAEFKPNSYTITVSASEHGNVSGGGTYDYGTTATLTATANEHYHFTQWADGNTDNPRTISVEGDATYTAEFAIDQHTITVTCNPQQGVVTGAGTYDYGTTATLTATATEHYHFTQWSDGNTDNPRTVSVEGDATYTAEFKPNPYIITVSASEHGSANGGGTYDYGTTATLTATANEHYHFAQWSDGNTDNPRTVSVEGDATYTAEFAIDQHTITTNAQNGTIAGGGTYDYGTTATLTATANEHYHFTQWTDGNTDNPRMVSVESDATYTAEFAIDQHTITATCDLKQGGVTGAGMYDYGTQVTLTATANAGYKFSQWSNGVKDNPYLFTATEDLTLEAQFTRSPATAVNSVPADNTTVRKVFRDGQVLILRGNKTYTTTGVEVK